jgi:hypothetical protein
MNIDAPTASLFICLKGNIKSLNSIKVTLAAREFYRSLDKQPLSEANQHIPRVI